MRSSIQPLRVVQHTRLRHCVWYVEVFAAILLWSVAASPVAAAPLLVQHVSKDAGSTSSSSLAFPANNTAGNWIGVVIRAGHSSQVLTVSDTRGNSYHQAVQFNQTLDAPNGETLAIYYAENIAGGSNTITVSESLTNNTLRFAILEYSGVATSNSLDVTSAAQGSGTTLNSGTATTTVGSDLILGLVATANGETFTAGSGYVIEERAPAAPNTKLIAEDAVQASPGAVSVGATLSASDNGGALLAAFKAASGTLAPSITSLTPNSGPVGTSVTITGSNFGATQSTSQVLFSGSSLGPSSWGPTSLTVTVPSGATSGNFTVVVAGMTSNGVPFTVVPPPPIITSLSLTLATVGTPITITGSNFGPTQGTSTVTFNGASAGIASSWSVSSITVPVPAGATTGPAVVTVGGQASNGVAFTVQPPPPNITSLNPTSGIVGTPVTISGANFGAAQGTSSVTFNGVPAAPTSWSSTSILVPVPAGASTGPVLVGVGSQGSNAVIFSVVPNISSLNPTSGAVGTPVNIAGGGFGTSQGTSTISFNGIAAPPTSWSTNGITAPVPGGAGSGNIVVTVGGAASNGAPFTVIPSISSLNPSTGAVGSSVAITGNGFGVSQGTSTVTFNGTVATPTSWLPTYIAVTVPVGASTGTVAVKVAGFSSNGLTYTISPDTTPPTAPTNLTATAISGGEIDLSWSASTDNVGVTGYFVERCQGAGCTNFAQIASLQGNVSPSMSDFGVVPGTTYTYRLRATDAAGNLSGYSNTASATTPSASMTANAGTTPQSATISTAFANALAVTVKDAGSNPVSGVNVTFTAPGSGASGTFSNSTATITVATNASGVASAPFTANATAGGPYTVTAAATGLTTLNFSLTNTVGSATTMMVNAGTTPQSATINAAFANTLAVTVKDAGSNPVSGVNVMFTAPASGASGTFSNSTATIAVATNSSGVASAPFTANTTAGGPYTVTAAASGLTTVNFSLTNTAGVPSTMTANAGTTPQSATISTAFANALAVTVKDASSNPVSGVNVTFTAPGSGASGVFSNSTATIVVATNASGVASATFTANATAGGPYTVTAAASGLTTLNFSLTNLPPATGGIKLVQHTSKDAGTVSSSSLAFPTNNTAGDWIGVVIRAGHSGQVFTVSDTNKNTYHAAVQFSQTLDAPNGDTFAIFYAENISGGANTVTVSESISGNTLRFAMLEYSGVSSFNSLDVTAAAQGGSTSPNSGVTTTTVGGDLLLGEIMNGSGTTASAGTSFKVEEAVPASPNIKLVVEDQIQSSAGPASATATLGASVSWGATLAAFKPASAGGAGPNISGVSPASAMVGAPVTITGINFGSSQGASTVTFYGQPAGLASGWISTSITVNVPQGAMTGNVVVTVGGVPSNAVSFTVNTLTVVVTPIRAGIEISQTQQFIGTALYDPQNLGVNWSVDSIPGGNATVGTIDSSGFFRPGTQIGVHTVTAISMSNSSISATASIAITDFPGMFTYHNDNSRTGQNLSEYALTPALVSTATFGKLFSCSVDGAVYAQPLWVPNLTVGGAKHNVLFVATAHDSLYAFDADTSPCVILWQVNLIDSLHGGTSSGGVPSETTVPSGTSGSLVGAGAGDISPEIGVVGTPVIDPTTNTLYVVSKSVNPTTLKFFQRLHAIDIVTGSEKFGGPANISSAISIPGTGGGSSGGQLQFDPKVENQRPGLALANGNVYVGWGSHEDWGPWHGWLMSFNASTLALVSTFCSTPNGNFAGIWMGGGAPPIDSSNNLYLLTGNGDWDGVTSFGDSILKLDSGLSLVTWFTPSDQSFLANNDQDLGSGGAAILIDLPAAPVPRLMIGGGKQGSNQIGELFLLNRDNLGGMTSTDTQPQIVQKFSVGGRIFSTSTFWNNNLYIAGSGTRLKQYTFNPATEQFTFLQQSSSVYGFPGATAAVSSLGNANGVAWALDNTLYCTPQSPGCGPTVLHAYDATNISTELWNSTLDATGRDQAGSAVKFTVPTVANGKVYVGTRTEIDVYSLKPN